MKLSPESGGGHYKTGPQLTTAMACNLGCILRDLSDIHMDDLEDDPEALKDRFQRAADRMRKNTALSLSNEQKLQLYGYFKQANEGPCNMGKPGFFDFAGRAKWDAWKKLGDVSKENAMEQYIGLVSSVDPNWETTELDPSQLPSKESSGDMGGPSVSRYAEEKEEVVPDDQKTAFDWCKEGHVTRLAAMVTEDNINEKDEQGMALLHWACDRGHVDVVKLLVSKGADINTQDSDLQTPLHYGLRFIQLHEGKAELTFVQPNKAEAWERGLSLPLMPSQFQLRMDTAITPASSCDQRVVVLYLLSAGADASVKDCDGATAVEVANSPSTKELFPRQS